jgi:hypothetical protein
VLDHYRAISSGLAKEFEEEFRLTIAKVASNPLRFHPAGRFRRANLTRFPYHLLYRICEDTVRVVVLRHNKRHPKYGQDRI